MRAGLLFACWLLLTGVAHADDPPAPECVAPGVFEETRHEPGEYTRGLLWRLSKPGRAPSFLFGTIHVADDAIVELPAVVGEALDNAQSFAMEVVPDAADLMSFSSRMYFTDGRKLSDMLSRPLFEKVVRLLGRYHLPADAISLFKPWAAFLTMSYPPDFREVLDMQLLARARENGAAVSGLETLREQLEIFDTMALEKQIRLLVDTACNYRSVEADFEKMKSLYLARDLAGLYAYGQRYSQADDELYNELINKVLIERNYTMTERMLPLLNEGNAFIAVGAMHLPGREGMLALLARNQYEISLVY